MNVLVIGDTVGTPELRHEVPLGIPDSFFYAGLDGRRIGAKSAMESARADGLGTDLEVHPLGIADDSSCFADLTRTFAVGDPPGANREWHALCRTTWRS
jgi:hypothetical protein